MLRTCGAVVLLLRLGGAWDGWDFVSVVLLVVADALVVPRGMIPGRQSMKRHRKK